MSHYSSWKERLTYTSLTHSLPHRLTAIEGNMLVGPCVEHIGITISVQACNIETRWQSVSVAHIHLKVPAPFSQAGGGIL